MKTCDEMVTSLLQRRDEYNKRQQKRNKIIAGISSSAVCCALVVCAVLILPKLQEEAKMTGELEKSVPMIGEGSSIQIDLAPETPEITEEGGTEEIGTQPSIVENAPEPAESAIEPELPVESGIEPEEPVESSIVPEEPAESSIEAEEPEIEEVEIEIDAGKATENAQKGTEAPVVSGLPIFWWKNKLRMGGSLYWALEKNPDDEFYVTATFRPTTGNITDFVYEGKTLAEWTIEADNERILPEKMGQLLKLGDDLKYGDALCETGNAEGIKWDRNIYDETVSYLGDLIDRYIVDGEFLKEELEEDLAAMQSVNVTTLDGTTTETYIGETSARTQYALAYNAYLDTVLPAAEQKLTENGIRVVREAYMTNSLNMTVTAEQLENLPLDDLENWVFDLASSELKGSDETKGTDAVWTNGTDDAPIAETYNAGMIVN